MNAVEIRNLTLRYNQAPLFADFSFCLPKGKWISLLGASGVGKSTLLRAIAGLENTAKTQGEIHFPQGGKVSYMAQQDALYPWLSVLDNVQLIHHLNNTKNAATIARAKQLLTAVNMDNHQHKACYYLSGGQRQRIALARTLMQEAEIILMDEPFSALDAISRLQLQNLAHTLLKDKTVLFITHDPQEAIRLSDEIYILQHYPATLSTKISPIGDTPRELVQHDLWQLQQYLLNQLMQGAI
ncbi:ABC transporter ATP-binding protein [Pasteurella oralis]|uniref:ABC transporter ATP-binding protein n=1 Tax=Pasteurella oralis TaxID=1071947 RepID=A0ABW4NVJ6_9PAST|nr:ABC transporter ATP-binding protein [Pasteurella oralis]